jgi:hypothetical protein
VGQLRQKGHFCNFEGHDEDSDLDAIKLKIHSFQVKRSQDVFGVRVVGEDKSVDENAICA